MVKVLINSDFLSKLLAAESGIDRNVIGGGKSVCYFVPKVHFSEQQHAIKISPYQFAFYVTYRSSKRKVAATIIRKFQGLHCPGRSQRRTNGI